MHGDLTPSNVLYEPGAGAGAGAGAGRGGRLVLLDFGHSSVDYRATSPGKGQRGGRRHFLALRKHKWQSKAAVRAPLHPLDDVESWCYVMAASLGALPWEGAKTTSSRIRKGKEAVGAAGEGGALGLRGGAAEHEPIVRALEKGVVCCRAAQAEHLALEGCAQQGAGLCCCCSSAGGAAAPAARCWCGVYDHLLALLGAACLRVCGEA